MMSEPMDMDDFPQNQPLPSEAETPHGEYDDPPVLRRRRAIDDQVEKVTDETGEMVRGAFLQFLETYPLKRSPADDRFDDEFDPQQQPAAEPTAARTGNFYFAQLEEIERFGLTTMYVDFENLQDFTVNGETGVLAQAIAQQYYRYPHPKRVG
jgi:hypothetical protein